MSGVTKGRLSGCNDNIGGLTEVYIFSYVEYQDYLIRLNENILTSFPTTDIYLYETRSEDISFNEDTEENLEVDQYNQSLELTFYVINTNDEVYNLIGKDVRVIFKDRLGNYRIAGLYNGLTVDTINMTTGSSRQDLNGYKLSLTGIEDISAPYITNLSDAGFVIGGETFRLLQEDGFAILQEDGSNILLENG